jgi:enediyne biosynthesis protein E4
MPQHFARRHVKRVAACGLIFAFYLAARLPTISRVERARLASQFRFVEMPLPSVPGPEMRSVRPVNPSIQHIAGWISSVGAAVALADIDGDGLPNDLCYVDVRTDQVIVAPVPGTGARYRPFALDAGRLFDRATMAPMGCLPGDVNEDGRMDLLVYYWGRTPLIFLQNGEGLQNGDRSFTPTEIVPDERWFTNAATFADLDGDGHPDLVVANYFPDGAHILDAASTQHESMQHSMSRALNSGEKHIFLWSGAGNGSFCFKEVKGVLPDEINHGWTLAVGAQDLDGDLLPELYFANDFGPDRLLHNLSTPGKLKFELLEGARDFATPGSKVLGHDSFKGMGVDFGDVNGDGLPDILVSNISAPYALEESNLLFVSTGKLDLMKKGVAPYVDRSEPLGVSRAGGWAWDSRFVDLNNDGVPEILQAVGFLRGNVNRWPELHEIAMGNDELLSNPDNWHDFRPGDDLNGHDHNPFFVRASDGRYYDLAAEVGLAQPHVSRGIAVADVDGDGRLDYAIANQWETSIFVHNESNAGQFLGLRLRIHNRPAIGAWARVQLPNGHSMTAQVDGGTGHSGKRSPDLHFGLGHISPNAALDTTIRWRNLSGIHEKRMVLRPGWHTEDLDAD